MLSNRLEAMRDAAARGVIDKLHLDQSRAPRELEPLLRYIEEHLFDPEFSVQAMREDCQVRDNSIVTRFRRFLEARPSAYAKRKRLEVAAELLRTSSEEIWKISELVGFASPQVFTRNFKDAWGTSPGEYRQDHGAAGQRSSDQPLPESKRLARDLQKAVEGTLHPDRAETLIQHLESMYRTFDSTAVSACSALGSVGETIRQLTHEGAGSSDRSASADARSCVELLLRLSRLTRDRNRRVSLRLANLALSTAQESAVELGEEGSSLCALSWAWVGAGHRRLLDFERAEDAFEQAELAWNESDERGDQSVGAEILHLKSFLWSGRQRYDEALELMNQAIEMVDGDSCDTNMLSTYLLQRGCICSSLGEPEAALPDFYRALKLAKGDGRLEFCASQCLTTCYALAGRVTEAQALLPETERLALLYADPVERLQVLWTSGKVYEKQGETSLAEAQLEAAQEGFRKLQAWAPLAGVTLELAQLRQRHKCSGAVRAAAEAKALLEELNRSHDAKAAGDLLKLVLR